MIEQKNLGNILRRVLRQWQLILMVSISVALLSGVITSRQYQPIYQTEALIVINSKWSSSGEIYVAQETVGAFQEVITSNLLQKKVAEVMGLDMLPGQISCRSVINTNMMYITVQADSPKDAMMTIYGVLDHHSVVTKTLIGDVVLRVLEEPVAPTAPTATYREANILVRMFALSGLCAAVLLFVYFYLRDDIKNEHQVEEKLDTKLFASIHHENVYESIRLPMNKRRKKGILVTDPTVGFRYIETFQKMCMKLEYSARRKDAKTIVVTSVQENEGKSTIAANLALSLTKIGKKVLLIDLDLRKPAIFKLFEMTYTKNGIQVGDVLAGYAELEEAFRKVEQTDLYLLAGNRSYHNSAKLLGKEQVKKMLELAKKDVDYVILDTSPLSLVADAEEIMSCSDMGLLVVKQNGALAKYVNDAIDTFRSTGCELLGCVLNDIENGFFGRPLVGNDGYHYHYKYGYGGYYGKYGKREEK